MFFFVMLKYRHESDMASEITGTPIACSIACSVWLQGKAQKESLRVDPPQRASRSNTESQDVSEF